MKDKLIKIDQDNLKKKYETLSPLLSEKAKRAVFAADALSIGRGGITLVSRLSGLSRMTLHAGIKELNERKKLMDLSTERSRKEGGGRKKKVDIDQGLVQAIEDLVNPHTLDDPMRSYLYTGKSLRKLAEQLEKNGYDVSHRLVGEVLKSQGYTLTANRKTNERGCHPESAAQFEYINILIDKFSKEENPVVSVDCKKKELIGNFKNITREWTPKGNEIEVEASNPINRSKGKAISYGIGDVSNNKGWINVGVHHDTAEFAVNSIKQWWKHMGSKKFLNSSKLLILADGGSNRSRNRLWGESLQDLANELQMEILVSHLPPGTSKWNKIEQMMLSFTSMNWRAKSLTCLQTIIKLISPMKTKTELTVKAKMNQKQCHTGIKVTNGEMQELNIKKNALHGDWNYTIKPTPILFCYNFLVILIEFISSTDIFMPFS